MNSSNRLFNQVIKTGLLLPAVLFAFAIAVPASAQAADGADRLEGKERQACASATRQIEELFDNVNRCPVAEAGADLPIVLGTAVPLDASGSTDIDGQRLNFEWTLIRKPSGSGAMILDPDQLRTQFSPDLAGDYTFEVRVTDSEGANSVDRVTFSTTNVAPVARAGSDATVRIGEPVLLDASRSYDLDGDTLAYRWSLIEQPQGSDATLFSPDTPHPSVTLDRDGDYRIELSVKDRHEAGQRSELILSTRNSAPSASAGRDRTVGPNSTIFFDSTRSSDFDQDALSYHWSVLAAPDSDTAVFDNPLSDSPALTLGGAGLYLVQLVVDDGVAVSNPATTLIEVKRDRLADFDLNDFLPLTNRAGGDDTDGDGVLDPVDNCVLVANAPQRDTDGDGIGNFCDPDLNNDGVVNFLDITAWTPSFLTADEDADFNGDGVVNFLDYIIITNAFLQQPGPPGTIVWVSLVDGNFNDRTNWEPQIVPSAGTTAIIDVVPAVTVTQSGGSITVKNLVQNENLVLNGTTFEATGALELGGSLSATSFTLNNTQVVPSLAGVGSASLNLTNAFTDVSWSVPVTLNNSANVNVFDGLSINSSLTIDAPSSPTGLIFQNDQTVDGTGTIILDGVGNSVISEPRLLPVSGTTVLFDSALTIRGGKGTIGQTSASVILNGAVNADVAGESIQINGNTWSGTGTLRALNGGDLLLSGTLDNALNTLNIDAAGGTLRLANGGVLRNTDVQTTPGSVMTVLPGITSFDALAYTGDLSYVNSATTNVSNGMTLNGVMTINAPSSPTGLTFLNDQTLDGMAIITFNGTGNSVISEPRLLPGNGVTLNIASTVMIDGGTGKIGQSNGVVNVAGTVNANVDGETILIEGNNWSGDGSLLATNNGQLSLSGSLDNAGATINVDTANGSWILNNGAALRNAVIAGTPGTELTVQAGLTTFEALDFTGDVSMVNAASTNVTGGLSLNGTLVINAPSSPTGLLFLETQTFDGTATVVFNGVGNSVITEPRLLPVGATTTLTIGENVTVRGGKGTIGQTSSNLVMLGALIADTADETIRIGGQTWFANGSFEATNGGEIAMFGNLDNGGDSLPVDSANGSFTLLNGTSLSNATFNGTAGTELLMPSGTNTLNSMTLNHDVRHANGANSNVSGGLTINGTSVIESPTSPTGYIFTETQSLGGAATIVFDSVNNTVISEPRLLPTGPAGTVLTIDSTVTISGSKGTIGQTARGLIMNGTVNATVDGQSIRVVGAPWSGTGSLVATNGGVLELQGTLENANQTLSIDTAGGALLVLNGTALRNATLDGAAGTEFTFPSGSTTMQNILHNGDLTLNNGANITFTDGLTLNGTATINAPTSPTGLLSGNTQTLGGNATIIINGAGNSVISEPRLLPLGAGTDVLTIGPNVVIRGGNGTIGNTSRALIVQGQIVADEGTLVVSSSNLTNEGVLEAQNANTLIANNVLSMTGELYAGSDSIVEVNGTLAGMADSSVIRIDVGPSGVTGLIDAAGSTTLDGTLSFNAVDGFSPTAGDVFTFFSGTLSGVFDSVTTSGLGAGQGINLTYDPALVSATVTN